MKKETSGGNSFLNNSTQWCNNKVMEDNEWAWVEDMVWAVVNVWEVVNAWEVAEEGISENDQVIYKYEIYIFIKNDKF